MGRVTELSPGQVAEVTAAGGKYVICNVAGTFYALDGVCPHRGAPLAQGALHGFALVCPWHAWEFDCRTGEGDCADVRSVPLTVEDGRLYLHAGTA